MTLLWLAIAIGIILFFLWIIASPKQGHSASNAPVEESNQLPPPQTSLPSRDEYLSPPPLPQQPERDSRKALGHEPLVPSPVYNSEQESIDEQIQRLMQAQKKIAALKLVRNFTGWGLKKAKDYLDRYPAIEPLGKSPSPAISIDNHIQEPFDIDRHSINDRIGLLLQQGQRIEALKAVRQFTGWGLKQAKEYIDAYPAVTPLSTEASILPIKQKLRKLLSEGRKIDAIHLVQKRTGMMLADAKHYVEHNLE